MLEQAAKGKQIKLKLTGAMLLDEQWMEASCEDQ